jgi:hypothetical protein
MDADTLFDQANEALRGKDRQRARRLLIELLARQPRHEQGWLLLAAAVDDVDQALDCLRRALSLNPDNARAREWLALAEREKARRAVEAARLGEAAPEAAAATDDAPEAAATDDEAPAAADESRPVPRLGQYLLDFKFVTPAQLQAALFAQRRARAAGQDRRLGDILLEQGAISAERLNFAVREQARSFYSLFQD